MKFSKYELFGAAYGLGATRLEAADAPAKLRALGLVDRLKSIVPSLLDGGDIAGSAPKEIGNPKLKYLAEYLEFANRLIPKLQSSYASDHRPIIVGGDHSISIATVSAAAEHAKKHYGPDAEIGLLWVDSHADINTPQTTPSGNIHGMSVAVLLGKGEKSLVELCGFAPKLKAHNISFVGLRDLDPPEKKILKDLGINVFTLREIDLLGFGEVTSRAIDHVTRNTVGFVTSFDLDACDPSIAPGVCTPVRGGLTYREAHLMMELAAETASLLSVEVVELNPTLDQNGVTAELAILLLESAVGKRIL